MTDTRVFVTQAEGSLSRQLQIFLETMAFAIIAADSKGQITYVNAIAENLVGNSRDQLEGKGINQVLRLIAGESDNLQDDLFTQAIGKGEVANLALNAMIVSKGGEAFPVEGGAVPVKSQAEIVNEVLFVIRDASDRRDTAKLFPPKGKDTVVERSAPPGQLEARKIQAALMHEFDSSNQELAMALDTTLEGWARALELRSNEQEGHSRRVTELAVRLAKQLGVREDELIHLRRGAMLHDIGELGVPDSILNRSGALSADEWKIIVHHPIHAYNLLSPIEYLRPAIDIPYCHHEKWDGTGYPRGLRGDHIPFAARIFAVVDVWDALLSDRPYRKAWTAKKAYYFIKEQSGKHFDPKVADIFLQLIIEEYPDLKS
jgi:PAS domain S-box-containing protein